MTQILAPIRRITEGADMPIQPHPYRGSRIRNFRCPEPLDRRIYEFCERTGADAASLIRTAIEQFLDKHKPDKKADRRQKNSQ